MSVNHLLIPFWVSDSASAALLTPFGGLARLQTLVLSNPHDTETWCMVSWGITFGVFLPPHGQFNFNMSTVDEIGPAGLSPSYMCTAIPSPVPTPNGHRIEVFGWYVDLGATP